MTTKKNIALIFCGLVIGCGAATVAPVRLGLAQAPSAGWRCYEADRFPDVQDAASWRGAQKITEGMNQVAANAAPGTVSVIQYNQVAGSVVCVKN